jgi:hypothetical protein
MTTLTITTPTTHYAHNALYMEYAECHLCWMLFMLSVTNKPFVLNVVVLNVVMLSIVILDPFMSWKVLPDRSRDVNSIIEFPKLKDYRKRILNEKIGTRFAQLFRLTHKPLASSLSYARPQVPETPWLLGPRQLKSQAARPWGCRPKAVRSTGCKPPGRRTLGC